jgi:hypothetical protein
MGKNGSKLFDPMTVQIQRTFRYNEPFIVANTTGGSPVQYVFRATSIYDPNYTGTGHKPYGKNLVYLSVLTELKDQVGSANFGHRCLHSSRQINFNKRSETPSIVYRRISRSWIVIPRIFLNTRISPEKTRISDLSSKPRKV